VDKTEYLKEYQKFCRKNKLARFIWEVSSGTNHLSIYQKKSQEEK
jgi:hypothetical protein